MSDQRETQLNAHWQELVQEKLSGLRYGTILITVHDGQVVQIDCTDRIRFNRGESDSEKRKPLNR